MMWSTALAAILGCLQANDPQGVGKAGPIIEAIFDAPPPTALPPLPDSHVSMAVNVYLDPLLADFDRFVPHVVKGSNGGVSYTGLRPNPISIKLAPNDSRFELRTEIFFRGASETIRFPVTPRFGWSDPLERRPSLRVVTEGSLKLRSNYTLDLTAKVGLNVGNRFVIGGGPFGDIDVSELLKTMASASLQQESEKKLNEFNAKGNALLQEEITKAWDFLNRSQSLSNGMKLRLHPREVTLTQPKFWKSPPANGFTILAGVVLRPEILVGDVPPAGDPAPLPVAHFAQDISKHAYIYCPIYIDRQLVEGQLLGHLKGETIDIGEVPLYGRLKFEVRAVKLVPIGNKVALKLSYHWVGRDGAGTLYMIGTPTYDPAKKRVTIPDLVFENHSSQLVIDALAKARHDALAGRLRDLAVFDLAGEVDKLRDTLRSELRKNSQGHLGIIGFNFALADVSASPERDAFKLTFKVEGDMRYVFSPRTYQPSPPRIKKWVFHVDIGDEDKEEQGGIAVAISKLKNPDPPGAARVLRAIREDELAKVQLTDQSWGYRQLWKDYSLHQTESDQCFTGDPVTGEFWAEMTLRDDEERIDMNTEIYAVIEDTDGGTHLSKISYLKWRNNQKKMAVPLWGAMGPILHNAPVPPVRSPYGRPIGRP